MQPSVLITLLLVLVCASFAEARQFFGKKSDTEVIHGTVAVNVTAVEPDPLGKEMKTVKEMHVPFKVEVAKDAQLPENVHFVNQPDSSRALQGAYKKLGVYKLAEKIKNFKVSDEK